MAALTPAAFSQLTLRKTFTLPEGTGKFDHFAVDLSASRLFIAATGNHTIEVLDLASGKVNETITGLGKPHGLAWLSETSRLYASDGSQADLKIYENSPLKIARSIKLSDDADDMVYDAKTKLLYVGHGGGDAANPASVAVIDTTSQSLVTQLSVATHPEGLDIDNAKDRIFVNIADSAEVAVLDGATHTQSATWKLTRAKDNVPLAYDEEHQLLFVACRTPGKLLVLDGNSGKELSDLPSDAGADDIFYDAELHRVYLIAGAGAIDAYEVAADKTVRSIGVVHTSQGAKTGLLVPSQHALYIGAAATGGKPAEIRLYSTK
ncbi:YncE family protein [Acidisarcina polymorpha]|uniref:YncE family protein n=1 Tax=Acidisarcina polymorpha TaxID=2211140 RepID=UPI00123808F3|nr:YncE family protein [Acidisarcina polymorpha]